MDLFVFMTVFLTLITLWTEVVTPVQIKLHKVDWRELLLDSASIECLCADLDGQASRITSLQITGPDNNILASLDGTGSLNPSDTYVMGEINADIRQTNLKLIIPELYAGHSGTYSCTLGYVAVDGSPRTEVAKDKLHVRKQDVNQIIQSIGSNLWVLQRDVSEMKWQTDSSSSEDRLQEEVIKELQKTVETQSQAVKDLQEAVKTQSQIIKDLQDKGRLQEEVNKDLQEGVRTQNETIKNLQEGVRTQNETIKNLQEGVRTQNETIKNLEEKDQPCGFSARYDYSNDKMVQNKVLVFSLVDINIGDGYNATTGMFTAPRSGMYAFHLTVLTPTHEYVQVDIYANDQVVGKIYAEDEDTVDQSSISVAVRLLEGQIVKPVVVGYYNHNALYSWSHHSVFSGYLVQAM